jgi:hypothetical protein
MMTIYMTTAVSIGLGGACGLSIWIGNGDDILGRIPGVIGCGSRPRMR